MSRKKQYAPGIANRANIVMAARKCFALRGFFDTSMFDIEKAAETTRGVLYHHFASKDEMILEIISVNLENAATKLETDLVQLQATGEGDLEQLMSNMLTLVEQITFGPSNAMSVHVWSLSLLNTCWRRSNIDHLCRLNFDQGLLPAV